jgi:hypothetical protein
VNGSTISPLSNTLWSSSGEYSSDSVARCLAYLVVGTTLILTNAKPTLLIGSPNTVSGPSYMGLYI